MGERAASGLYSLGLPRPALQPRRGFLTSRRGTRCSSNYDDAGERGGTRHDPKHVHALISPEMMGERAATAPVEGTRCRGWKLST